MSTSTLNLFPSPPKQTDFDLKKAQLSSVTRNSGDLRGLSLQLSQHQDECSHIKANRVSLGVVAEERTVRPYLHTRKRSSTPDFRSVVEASIATTPTQRQQTMPALRSAMKSCTPLSTTSSIYSRRTSVMTPASAIVDTPATSYTSSSFTQQGDKSVVDTPLTYKSSHIITPSREGASSAPPEKMSRFPPRSQSLRSVRTARSKIADTVPDNAAPNRSMFPQYDMSKPLSQQTYYSSQRPTAPSLKIDTKPATIKPVPPVRQDSGVIVALPKNYECIPEADNEDLAALWTASTRLGSCSGRKVRMAFSSTTKPQRKLQVTHAKNDLFSVVIDKLVTQDEPMQLSVSKTNPANSESSLLSNISLPTNTRSQATHATCHTPVFPHQAAIDALAAASNSPQAHEIARFDPSAKSRAAETLAKEAVGDAHRHYTSELVRTTRARDSVGTVSAQYKLEHPTAGELAITVARSIPLSRIYTTQMPQIKVTIHHPTATPEAIASESLALMSLDFAHSSCVIDLPALLALEADYMLDTAISALFATAVMESENSVQPAMTFDAPPTQAIKPPKKKRSTLRKEKKVEKSRSAGLWPLRKTEVREIDQGVEEMPGVARGALAVIELGIQGAFWALEKGFKTLDERSTSART